MVKRRGVDRIRKEMTSFHEFIDDLNLRDLRYMGAWYTWECGKSLSMLFCWVCLMG